MYLIPLSFLIENRQSMTGKVSPLIAILPQLILDDKLSNAIKTIKKTPLSRGFLCFGNVSFKLTLQMEVQFFRSLQPSYQQVDHKHCCVDLLRSNKLSGFYHL